MDGVSHSPRVKRNGKDHNDDNNSKKSFEYCVLTGVLLVSYTDFGACERGDHPMSVLTVVGASAWNPVAGLAAEVTSPQATYRMVTNQGTHYYCTAPSPHDCGVWLASLHAGLEASYSLSVSETPSLKPPTPSKSFLRRGGMFREKALSCQSCGRGVEIVTLSTPLPQYGMENRCFVCPACLVAQGVLLDIYQRGQLYVSKIYDDEAMSMAKQQCQMCLDGKATYSDEQGAAPASAANGLRDLISSPTFGPLRRSCPTLEQACSEFEQGSMEASEFFEFVDNQNNSEMLELKKEAFRVAGDMGSAIKLLSTYCLSGDVSMLSHILTFFIEMCEEGDVDAVAFFWPQFLGLHLKMLPPKDWRQLQRVELMEDFLLTVSVRYSVHLALELMWGYVADLEESLFHTGSSNVCRRRRFSVLRFVCELESHVFDFVGGWGGGSVSLGNMVTPSPHQVQLLRKAMDTLNGTRQKASGNSLPISARSENLQRNKFQQPPEVAAERALRAAKNADYFSSHLSFTRRLCDVAEKLRFLEPERRSGALEEELAALNASGSMGGDPLNRVRMASRLDRVVRVPQTEGHVFRSKERTPVLLLMEVVEEVDLAEKQRDANPRSKIRSIPTEEDANNRRASNYVVDVELPKFELDAGERLVEEGHEDDGSADSVNMSPNVESPQQQPSVDYNSAILHSPRGMFPTRQHPLCHFVKPYFAAVVALGKFNGHESGSPDMPRSRKSMEKLVNDVMVQQLDVPKSEDEKEADTLGQSDSTEANTANSRAGARPSNRALGNRRISTLIEGETGNALANDEIRRNVLTTIMTKGMKGSNAIAAASAVTAQRSLQQLDRKRAVEMILNGEEVPSREPYCPPNPDQDEKRDDPDLHRQRLLDLGISEDDRLEVNFSGSQTEDDEAMESLRLLLIQNQVAQGSASDEGTAGVSESNRTSSVRNVNAPLGGFGDEIDRSEIIEIDAGDVDPRLSGCGSLPPAVLSALTLWKGGVVTTAELLELVKKDIQYLQHSELSDSVLQDNSAFWGRFAFGERWAEKKARIGATSPSGSEPGWDLVGVIVKSNDDLRQEAFVMQLIELCREAFEMADLELWVHPYRILATGRTTGIIECVKNAMSFDSLKKRPGYGKGGLRGHLERMAEFSPDPTEALRQAQLNFVRSLAAYSLMSHFFLIKDRHNGNLLLDTAGHVIHIDFGFVFGIAPGGSFSLEMSTPFKLTEEMLDAMGGMQSPFFGEFVTLFCCGFLALQAHVDTFLTIVEITCSGSSFKCFEGRESKEVVAKMRARFCPELSKEATVAFALDLIKQATQSYGTKQYDYFQYLSQGIAK